MTNPYLEAAADLAQEKPRNRYAAAAADLAESNKASANAAVYGAAATPPDAAASALKLARGAGLPLDVVQRNLPAVQQQEALRRVQADTEAAPVLRQRYANPSFAAVAHDDSGALARIERTIGKATAYLFGATPTGGVYGDIGAGVHRASGGAAGFFRAVSETAALPFDALERFPSIGGNPLRRLSEGFGKIARDNAESANRLTDQSSGLIGSGVSAGVQSAVQSLTMAPLALLPGGQAAALTGMSGTSGGQSYQEARDAGQGQGTALAYGASNAVIEYATEKLPLSKLIGDLKEGAPILKTLLHQAATEVPGEQAATVLQDLNEWATLHPDRPFSEYLAERPSAAAQTLVATLVGMGTNVAVMKAVNTAVEQAAAQRQQAQTAVESAEVLREAIKDADASALKRRDPETFAEFVKELNPDAVVYVAPEHLQGLDLSAVPAVAAQVAEAQATGGDVQMGLSELLAHLPGNELLPHLRTSPDAMTAAEAQDFNGPARIAENLADKPSLSESMDEATWDEYQAAMLEAEQRAEEQRDAGQLRNLQWLERAKGEAVQAIRQEAQAARAEIEASIAQEVERRPVYAAQRWMDANKGHGLPADVVAEQFGFRSGEEMERAIKNAEPADELVMRLTDERLTEEHPDIADAIAQERSAEALVAEEARTRILATEAAALAKAVGNRHALNREAKAYAQSSIARRIIRNARPSQFRAAAARLDRQATAAFMKGETATAAQLKRSQFLQTALVAEATAFEAEHERALRLFKRVMQGKDDGRDGNLTAAARAILSQYGFGRSDKTPADHLRPVENYDPELHADLLSLLDGLPPPVSDHRDMTVGDFRVVAERVDAVWTLARTTREIEVDGQRMQIEEAAAQLATRLADEPAAKRESMVGSNERLDLRMRLAGMRAALRRVEAWADARDKGDKHGPFRRIVWNPVSEAVTRYRATRNEYVNRFLRLLKTIEPTLKPGKIDAPELKDGMVFADRSALLHALLHTGNESNKRKLLIGYGWGSLTEDGALDTRRWDAFLRRMHAEGKITKTDWDFVQSVWDLTEDMKPRAQAAHKRMFGTYFEEVTADAVQTPFGDYPGGYVPAVTDRLLVPEARSYGAMDDMLASQNSPMFPAVNRGFTKARIENYARPLALDLRQIPAHIDKVARFAELGPTLRDAARLVTRNNTFREAMNAVDPTAIESMLVPWLKRTAVQSLTKAPESQADRAVARIANRVRSRTGLLLMAANVVNTLQQVTGLSVAALRVKPTHLASALVELVTSPSRVARTIDTLSPWMQQRGDNSARDVERAIDNLLTNPGPITQAEQLGNRYGMALQQAAQNVIDRIVWTGAYRQALAEGEADAEAIRQADSAVRMTQSSFAPEDAAKVEHAGAFTRLFLQFYSYFGGQANLIATEVQNARTAGRLAVIYLLGFAIPAFMADVIGKAMRGDLGGDDDDEELDALLLETFFVSQARYAMAMIPVAGQAGNAALGQFTPEQFDDRIGSSPAYSAIEATVRAPFSLYRAIEEDANPRRAVRDTLTAIAMLTGIPLGPLVRPLGYLADEDREDVTVQGLVTGRG